MYMDTRAALFWVACIPARLVVTYAARRGVENLRLAAWLLGLYWLAGYPKKSVGHFGGVAWWSDERPLHGALWTMYALSGDWRFLLADTAFGAANWIVHRV